MSDETEGTAINYYVCDAGHVHLSFLDADGKELFGVAIDIEDWFDITDEIDSDIDMMMAEEEAKEAVKH